MHKMEFLETQHWIFGILNSKSKWELPFLAKGNETCHLTALCRIKAVGNANGEQREN